MKQNFLEFLNNRNKFITESFNRGDADKAFKLIDNILHKHIKGLIPLVGYVKTKQGQDEYLSKQYIISPKNSPEDSSMFQFNINQSGGHSDIYSVDFFKDLDYAFTGNGKANLTIFTLGNSIAYILPIVWTVANSKNYNISEKEAIDITKKSISSNKNESKENYIGTLTYIVESLDDIRKLKKEKLNELSKARAEKDKSPEAKNKWKSILNDLHDIDAAIRRGANSIEDLKIAVKHNVSLSQELDNSTQDAENKCKEEREDPEFVFKKMEKYATMVIKGITPSVILCGAPGVGKSYRVKQLLKAKGYKEGHNLLTIKGKCTPRILYLRLMEYKEKGKVIVIDDADALVGPNAPEDSINILKAALDSTSDDEGRKVTYGVAGPLKDDEGVPVEKSFYFNGGVIVITNYQAGKLDTALRGRSFIQDINFTTEEILGIIKKLMPAIDPDHLSPKSKIKAYDYLVELSKTDKEVSISIRTFGLCAKIFESISDDSDFSDEDAKHMIKEQMKLQYDRITGRGGKY